ncbi:sulfurtransferase [Thalassotalea euphylliae]|uniref:Sulfurtransferase n=1 Tax=Thalassotalea euphylliae TaxID=1655234 RepID=A0A3E0TLY3_9GAMM|nr:sulfurtransferase [Thalassotalea euphylliae]REL25498.1 sulfurtransferase [Thalassotalea euphylliae]
MFTHQPLISAEALYANLTQQNLLIFDASMAPVAPQSKPKKCWPSAVIPGAKRMDIEHDFCDHHAQFPHTMLGAKAFEQAAQSLGITGDEHLVVYDDLGLFSAARAWWMLTAMGHQHVSVLDGGLPHWLKRNLPVESVEHSEPSSRGTFGASYCDAMFVDHHFVGQAIEQKSHVIVDARATARFFGQTPEPRVGVRVGHMPEAKSLPFTSLIANGLLLDSEQLALKFEQLNPNKLPMIMTCGSGITACILALAADIAGYKETTVYDGSWAEWGALTDLPVTTA